MMALGARDTGQSAGLGLWERMQGCALDLEKPKKLARCNSVSLLNPHRPLPSPTLYGPVLTHQCEDPQEALL